MKNILFTLLFVTSLNILSYGQSDKKALNYLPSIGGHIGTISYLGDIKGDKGSNMYTHWRLGYGFYLEKKIGSIFGVSANGIIGKAAKSQLDNNVFINFESQLFNVDVNLLLDFDNGVVINESSLFSPFISVGFGYMTFTPKGDLSTNGITYNHWSDGTLRDLPESTPGADSTSNLLVRDYDYETTLKDSLKNYSKSTFTIPLRVGLKFKLSRNIAVRVSGAYILTMSDYIDNYADGGNDRLFYTSFGIQYDFAKGDPKKKDDKYKDFDFTELDNSDSDKDGVIDTKDHCQNTPEGVKVDVKGCPLDDDNDGVPDYKDKELTTPKGTMVNADGVTLTDEMIAARNEEKDSIQTEHRVFKASDLTPEEIMEIQKEYEASQKNKKIATQSTSKENNSEQKTDSPGQSKIPEMFQSLDVDGDGYISAKEVTNAIDGFFEGTNSLSAKNLNELIDFYFDQ
ncbi:MAG: EF-hand domain-containing protein [Vicingus serpentipes]|nr:EF-hand domain-containing protein [Vicingus serpentipes]